MSKIIYINQSYTLDIGEKSIQFENGIEYAKALRYRLKESEPIIFSSFTSKASILSTYPNAQLLRAIGHGYIQLPYSQEELNLVSSSIQSLNPIQLKDIIINYCQLRSTVRDGFHIFKNSLTQIHKSSEDIENKIKNVNSLFNQYGQELERDLVNLPQNEANQVKLKYKELTELFDPKDIDSLNKIRDTQEEELTRFISEEGEISSEEIASGYSWEILFLDDNLGELQDVFDILKRKKISYHTANTVEKATEIIENDPYNKITVVVSDYRLFENIEDNPHQDMQPKQGYDFLIELSKRYDRFNALVALSGLSKSFLMESFRKEQVDVKVYTKNVLVGQGYKLFIDDIEYLGERYSEVVNSMPQSSIWTKGQTGSVPMKPIYIYHRQHPNYLINENRINSEAEKFARELESYLSKIKSTNFTIGFSSVTGDVGATFNGNMDKDYPRFIKRMIQRRISYYLQIKGYEKNEIASLIQYGKKINIETDIKGDSTKQSKKTKEKAAVKSGTLRNILFNLAIEFESDLPYNILVEEKQFLQNYMQIPIYDLGKYMDQTHILFNEELSKVWDKGIPISLQNYYSEDNKLTLTGIAELPIFLKKWEKESKTNKTELEKLRTVVDQCIQLLENIVSSFPNLNYIKEIKLDLDLISQNLFKKLEN